jgi:hypothetical protein
MPRHSSVTYVSGMDLIEVVRLAGFEPATFGSGACSRRFCPSQFVAVSLILSIVYPMFSTLLF